MTDVQSPILVPFFGLMLTTFIVWVQLYVRRLTWIAANKPAARRLTTPEQLNQLIPEVVNYPSNNFKNLCELPILFYVICLYLVWGSQVDKLHIICAYGFFILRTAHSFVHCTFNSPPLRFVLYALASACLWLMVVRSALHLFIS